MYHVTPINDLMDHEESSTCWCAPKVELDNGSMICIHNAKDKREILEKIEEEEAELTTEARAEVMVEYTREVLMDDDIVPHVKDNLIKAAFTRLSSPPSSSPRSKLHSNIIRFIEATKMAFPHATYWCTRAGKAGCYRFHLLLLSVFQSVADEEGKGDEIEALSNQDHVITRINGRCYDITGELIDSMGYQPISDDEVRGYELMIYGSSDHWIKSDELSGVFDTPITDNTQEEK